MSEAASEPMREREEWDELGGNLIFIFSPKRAGSTMLQMMLRAHSQVAAQPEPHFLLPLKYGGYFEAPAKADYEPVNTSFAIREFVGSLPRGEEAYLDACRRFALSLYRSAASSKPRATCFADKTPPYVLHWEFITKLFPKARYLVLVRHPLAVLDSFARTFFAGDHARAWAEAPELPQYIAAAACFLREAEVANHQVSYEALVNTPEQTVASLLAFLDLPADSAVIDYGKAKQNSGPVGDPINAGQLDRPSDAYQSAWIATFADSQAFRQSAREMLDRVSDEDLLIWGYPRKGLEAQMQAASQQAQVAVPRRRRWRWYLIKRRIYFALRPLVRLPLLRRTLEKVRYYCDVLLRG